MQLATGAALAVIILQRTPQAASFRGLNRRNPCTLPAERCENQASGTVGILICCKLIGIFSPKLYGTARKRFACTSRRIGQSTVAATSLPELATTSISRCP